MHKTRRRMSGTGERGWSTGSRHARRGRDGLLRSVIESPARRRRLILLARFGIAALLLAWIGSRISLTDKAERRSSEGDLIDTRTGRIEGPWAAPAVRLRDSSGRTEELRASQGWRARPGLPTLLRSLRPGLLSAALLVFFAATVVTVVRWRLILRALGVDPGFGDAFRLTFLGLFFNLAVPGLTGGDVVKAIYLGRSSARHEAAFLSVLVDRIVGVLGLALLATAVVLPNRDRFREIATGLVVVEAAILAAGVVAFAGGRRRGILRRGARRSGAFWGVIHRTAEALSALRGRPRVWAVAVVLSISNHLIASAAWVLCARAVGDSSPPGGYLPLVLVANLLSSVPIAPGGWGVGEALYGTLFERYGSTFEAGVALSLTGRLVSTALSLPGLYFWIGGRRRAREAGTTADLLPPRGGERLKS